ncbi:MAG: HAD hydrolase-like protein [Candidatus Woesearchaeota archaeon]|nr:HAD hydrolase-like protein [Candidatus Woesearchaeota archaeon]
MIKAVAFDLGGVLFSCGTPIAVERISKKHGYEKNLISDLLSSEKSIKLRKGKMSDNAFWKWAEKTLPAGYNVATIKREWYDCYIIDGEVFQLIKELFMNKRINLLVFSGNIRSRVLYLNKKYGFRKYFDHEVYSFDHGCMKGSKEFVKKLISEAGCKPPEILYIDDNPIQAKPASMMGINLLIYKKGKIEELKEGIKRFGIALR